MRRLLVFQHVPYEILGTLNDQLKARGFRIRYINFGRHPDARPDISRYNGLVVLGGPMSVNDVEQYPHLATEVELIQQALASGIPILGICLGAQLIAKALGATIRPNEIKEIGWHDVSPTPAARDDPLFRDFAQSEKIFHWHGDTFMLPQGAVHLASSPLCPHQAFRYQSNVYGFQFHLEVDRSMIERWLAIPMFHEEVAETYGHLAPEAIRSATTLHLDRSKSLSERIFGRFIDLFQLPPKREMLGSGHRTRLDV